MVAAAFESLYAYGLGFPEVTEDRPWEHPVLKVKNKVFVFFGGNDELSLTVKLPASRDFAETFDFAAPAGYGLGRSGWITCRFAPGDEPDLYLLKRWLEESYRAVAPKKLGALLPVEE